MYSLALALRYLRRRRITLLGVTAVALGVFAFIVVVGVMEGFRKELRRRLRGYVGDVVVFGGLREGEFQRQVLDLLRRDDQVKAVSGHLDTWAILKVRGTGSSGQRAVAFKRVVARGVEPGEEARATDFADHLVDVGPQDFARAEKAGDLPWLLAGAELVERPTVPVGAEVKLLVPQKLGEYRPFSFRLIGTFRSGIHEYDSQGVYIPLAEAQRIHQARGATSRLLLRLTERTSPDAAAKRLQAELKELAGRQTGKTPRLRVVTGDDLNHNLLAAIRLQTKMAAAILFFYFLVAGVAVFAIMSTVVVEKTRDIGVVRAIGGSVTGVLSVFLLYGLAIGVTGVLLGVVAGRLTLERLDWLRHLLSQWTGWEPFPKELYMLDVLPWTFEARLVVTVAAVALGAVLLSSLYPARQAARLRPVETLRYE